MTAHSFAVYVLQCYFLLAGDKTIPIIYHVQRVRDGKILALFAPPSHALTLSSFPRTPGGSYVTRLVLAKQRGRSIFTIILSYQVPEPAQPTFAIPLLKAGPSSGAAPEPSSSVTPSILANIPSPDKCPLNEERYLRVLRNRPTLDGRIRKVLEEWIADRQNSAVEIRYVKQSHLPICVQEAHSLLLVVQQRRSARHVRRARSSNVRLRTGILDANAQARRWR